MTTTPDLALLTAKTVKLSLHHDSLKLTITGSLLYNVLFHHFYVTTPDSAISFKPSDVSHITSDGPMPIVTLQTKTR